jgi:hypothetical protein
MTERLVDVLNSNRTVLHTYPIAIGGSEIASTDAEYEAKALEAAAHAHLVPNAELKNLTARMHVSRGGIMAPYGHEGDVMSQTSQELDQIVRERAYFLWQQDGSPEGRAEEYWRRAHDQHLRERAYALWQQDGRPDDRADQHWFRTREFETH